MGGKSPHGFTIVETLIFLAVSSLMLTFAFAFINGKQSTTEFDQGIRQVVSNLKIQIQQVQNGTYTNNGNDIVCNQPAGSNNVSISQTAQNTNQGSNQGCQYIGEVFQFAPGSGVTPNSGKYTVFPVASNEFDNVTAPQAPITKLSQINPCAVYQPNPGPTSCSSYSSTTSNDALQTFTLPYGITVDSVTANGAQAGMVAYYTLAYADADSGNITDCNGNILGDSSVGGALGVDLIPLTVGLGLTNANAINNINQAFCGGQVGDEYPSVANYNSPVAICLSSGTTNQYALITLGSANNPESVDLQIQDTPCTP